MSRRKIDDMDTTLGGRVGMLTVDKEWLARVQEIIEQKTIEKDRKSDKWQCFNREG